MKTKGWGSVGWLLSLFLFLIAFKSIWANTQPQTTNQTPLTVTTQETGGALPSISLHFDWGEKNPALGIVKVPNSGTSEMGKWWVVFDDKAIVHLPETQENPNTLLKGIETLPTSISTPLSSQEKVVLQISTHSSLTPFVSREGRHWTVTFKDQALKLSQKVPIRFPQTEGDGIVIGLTSSGKEVRFIDPDTGIQTIVVPTHLVGAGMEVDQKFPDFHLLTAPQGLGVQIYRDSLTTQITPEQTTLKHPQGLTLSGPKMREAGRKGHAPLSLFAHAQDLDWGDRRQKINAELLDLPHSQHGPGELEIAWLLLGHGQPGEALGYLAHLSQERPSIIHEPLFQILKGMGLLLINRLSEAQIYLNPFEEDPEVRVWLTLINALQKPHHYEKGTAPGNQLRAQLQVTKEFVKAYPKPLRTQMVALILMSGIALRDVDVLTPYLDQESRPDVPIAAQVYDLARARVLITQNKPDAALQILGELMEKGTSPQIRSIASFDYITHRLQTKMIHENEAIPQLESIRIQWHGKWLDHQIGTFLAVWKKG